MVIKEGKFGKFMACSGYPACKTTKPILDIMPDVICPKDGGQIVRRKSRYGKFFYGCANYPQCDFVLWNEPVNQACPSCQAPMMVKKTSKKKGNFLLCMTCNAEINDTPDSSLLISAPDIQESTVINDEEN